MKVILGHNSLTGGSSRNPAYNMYICHGQVQQDEPQLLCTHGHVLQYADWGYQPDQSTHGSQGWHKFQYWLWYNTGLPISKP